MRTLALCAGYGGLEMAVGGDVVAYAEKDPFAAAVFAAHHPGTDNIGDLTEVDWTAVRDTYRPYVICAGFPCQDISNAGKREGITGARSSVWGRVADAVRIIRPRVVYLENVAAIRGRGLDVVAGDLAAIGYDASWTCLRASDAGAPHSRDRWFCLATPSDTDDIGRDGRAGDITQEGRRDESANGRGSVPEHVNLLPTPLASDGTQGTGHRNTSGTYYLTGQVVRLDDAWCASNGKDYGPAVRRWEQLTGREAPCPTEPGARDNRRLSPAFVEWMMGLPAGWVTDVPDIPRREQLRILGNGVVPQQARAAFEWLASQ